MATAKRKQKLKVFSTPIGFHDAYVAAPSQKAALEAWGASTNLFTQGSAHVVTDPKLTKVPLQNPGQVVKIPRGTHAEQLAALGKADLPKRKAEPEPEIVPKKAKKRPRKPSRAALEGAEVALDKLKARQANELDKIDAEIKSLEERRRDLQRRHERNLDKAQQRIEDERENYQAAIVRYEAG
jgi:hypothetical protein